MRLLVLGGTAFVGRHFAAAALERGHEVTLLTRGLTNPGLFPGGGAPRRLTASTTSRPSSAHAASTRSSTPADTCRGSCGPPPSCSRTGSRPTRSSRRSPSTTTRRPWTRAPRRRRPADPASEDVAAEYGGLKALCELAVEAARAGPRARRPPRARRRPARLHGPFQLLASPDRARRRGAGAGAARSPRLVHRRPRPRGLRACASSSAVSAASSTPSGPAEALSLGALLDECIAERRKRRRADLGERGVPAGERRGAVHRAAALDPRRRGRPPGDRHPQGAWRPGSCSVPSPRRFEPCQRPRAATGRARRRNRPAASRRGAFARARASCSRPGTRRGSAG